jgi:hypothetical protein
MLEPASEGGDGEAVDVQVLGNEAIALRTQVDSLRAEVLGFPHLPAVLSKKSARPPNHPATAS